MRNATEIEPSERMVVGCGGCGEALILLGGREDWRSEGRASFVCGACGSELPLPDGDEHDHGPVGDGRGGQAKAGLQGLSIGEYVKALRAKKTG